MKSSTHNQAGFGHLVIFFAVAVIALVGITSFRVLSASTPDATESKPSVSASKTVPDTLKSTADIKKASNSLDNTTIDGSVNPNSLDNDLNALL